MPDLAMMLVPVSGPTTEPSPLMRRSRPLTAKTRSAGMQSLANGNTDGIKSRDKTSQQSGRCQKGSQGARYEDHYDGSGC